MKKQIYSLISLLLLITCQADEQWESDYPMVSGSYEIIGKQCESGNLFTGKVLIDEVKPNVFVITRTINGKKIVGSGSVELVNNGESKVFRIIFIEEDKTIEGTFIMGGDLDNDGRMTGYVYPKGYRGKKPGLEAFFCN